MEQQSTVGYDPSKPYSWQPDQLIDLKGNEFGMLFNTLASVVNSPGFQEDLDAAHRTIAVHRLHQLMTQVMQRAVETGQVTEAPAAEQPITDNDSVGVNETATGEVVPAQ